MAWPLADLPWPLANREERAVCRDFAWDPLMSHDATDDGCESARTSHTRRIAGPGRLPGGSIPKVVRRMEEEARHSTGLSVEELEETI
jgi:hypothetical protein